MSRDRAALICQEIGQLQYIQETNMGDILIFHAPDGEAWANFLTNKLVSPYYELPIRKSLFNSEGFHFSTECHVQVLLLTPDLLEIASKNSTNFLGLIPGRCVVILLGINREEVQMCLRAGAQCDHLFACKVCYVTNDSTTITKTLVTIIETFEEFNPSDDDIYSVPPKPIQINHVHQIIPKHVTQGGNVYLLLDRKSDTDITIQCDQIDEGIVSDCLDKVVYSLKLPENIKGNVDLNIITEDQVIGEGRVTVDSKLDQMKSLLEDITDPIYFLCQSLGLSTYTSVALDTVLTQKLKYKSSPVLFQPFLSLNDVQFSDEKCSSCWPTLLHFAAEYNLKKFTEELLKYPGMIVAATTENCEGNFPSTIAEHKGHMEIGKRLLNFVLENKNDIDSGILTDPIALDLPPPEPHFPAKTVRYVNQLQSIPDQQVLPSEDSDYIRMDLVNSQMFAGNRSASDNDAYRMSLMNRDESPRRLVKDRELPRAPYIPKKPTSQSFDSSIDEDEDDAIYSVPPPASPLIQPRFRPDVFSDTSSHRSSTISTASSTTSNHQLSTSQPISPVKVEVTHSEAGSPSTFCISEISFQEQAQSKLSAQFLSVDSGSREDVRVDKSIRRNKTIQAKISSFLRKFKTKMNSSADVPKTEKRSKIYGRSIGSDPGFDSDSTLAALVFGKQGRAGSLSSDKVEVETERDSGSFSEEDDDKIHAMKESVAKRDVKKTKKGDKAGLARKKSVRVTRVLKEETTDAPVVPIKPSPDNDLL
ncbi:hypothetical protein LOTGIDRAFT_154659 [Lottia gigantea]|uniref:DBB domain-containing protein n=1 Tax=Lottia gigantea TaxID=225164 RepID=V3ZS25_LOTGI|nr:hypothetical protein LOTGIDRAFT_154659 [Lottia gigantea]ESO87157.1 hypothetical protein LOTGIDRAFT_154659 [Lottia gigantea]